MVHANKHTTPLFQTESGEKIYEFWGKTKSDHAKHSLAHIEVSAGQSTQKRYHPETEESLFILNGKAKIIVDDKEYLLSPEDNIVIFPNQKVQVFNAGPSPLQYLAICIPAWTPQSEVLVDQ